LQWFEALFEGGYDDIMNNLTNYVNYGHYADNDGDSSGNHNSNSDDNDNDDSNE